MSTTRKHKLLNGNRGNCVSKNLDQTDASSPRKEKSGYERQEAAPVNSRLNVVVRFVTSFELGQNGCWPSRGSQLPRTLSSIFSLCCPLNDRRRAAHSFFKIDCLSSLFSCLSFVRLCLLILLLFLMRGNIHPNTGSVFPCSVWAGNVTWRGRSVQCCACSKWVHLRRSPLPLSKF